MPNFQPSDPSVKPGPKHAHNFQNLTGRRFGRWTVMGYAGKVKKLILWHCRCDCGNERTVYACNLRSGMSKGCEGCRADQVRITLQGLRSQFPLEYQSWQAMKKRCNKPQERAYKNYGGRGITVCDRWNGPNSFENFLHDMGPKPSVSHELERIDNDGNYCPENCCWATTQQQARNRRSNHIITYKGKTMCLSAWAEFFGFEIGTLKDRINRYEMPFEVAISKPLRKNGIKRRKPKPSP